MCGTTFALLSILSLLTVFLALILVIGYEKAKKNNRRYDFYLCGAMTGYKDHNYPAFNKYAALLRSNGYTVWSPAEQNDINDPFESCMKRDLGMVVNRCNAIAILPGQGWRKSVGANAEVNSAHVCGKKVFNIKANKDGILVLSQLKTKDKTPYYKKNITRASLIKKNSESPK